MPDPTEETEGRLTLSVADIRTLLTVAAMVIGLGGGAAGGFSAWTATPVLTTAGAASPALELYVREAISEALAAHSHTPHPSAMPKGALEDELGEVRDELRLQGRILRVTLCRNPNAPTECDEL